MVSSHASRFWFTCQATEISASTNSAHPETSEVNEILFHLVLKALKNWMWNEFEKKAKEATEYVNSFYWNYSFFCTKEIVHKKKNSLGGFLVELTLYVQFISTSLCHKDLIPTSVCCTIRSSSHVLPRAPAAVWIPGVLCVETMDYSWQVTVIHCGWKDTSLFGLCTCCAFSTGHKCEADIKHPHRTGPLLSLSYQIKMGKYMPLVLIFFLWSRGFAGYGVKLELQTSLSKVSGHWPCSFLSSLSFLFLSEAKDDGSFR